MDRPKRVLRYHRWNVMCFEDNAITPKTGKFNLFPEIQDLSLLQKKRSTLIFKFNVYGSVHRKYIPIYIQKDATLYSLFISGNCSTCFGWFLHPSSGRCDKYQML